MANVANVYNVVLPVLNEAAALPWVLRRMPCGFEPIVVDNGSTDGSAQIARDLGAAVVKEPQPGFGAACFAGLETADSEFVCFMDCDGSLDPRELPRLIGRMHATGADLMLGRRRPHKGAWPLHARLANRAVASWVSRRYGLSLRDLGPMRVANRKGLLQLGIEDRRFGWPVEMVLRAALAGWRVEETPVPYLRRSGRSKVTGSFKGTIRTAIDLAKVIS